MVMKLVFATNNLHKLQEIKQMLNGSYELLCLNDIGCEDDIPENQATLEGNAAEKSFFIYNKYGLICFADDTGLEIEALNGEPGVYSARYAGEERSAGNNMDLVLAKLDKINNRKARFRTVVSLVIDGNETQFEGIVDGQILEEKQGETGFGYDPIFKPDESDRSFAEMPMDEKNKISHRGRAIQKLIEYLIRHKGK
ncbi:MAG: non-canonical purine NTP diphosphatase [Bacteroidota bacterium]|nr:non-canonical purine NTP diphosphatase [Bacteroidota bacterium]